MLKQNIFPIPGRPFRAGCCCFTLLTLEICWLKWPISPNMASSAEWGRGSRAWPAGERGEDTGAAAGTLWPAGGQRQLLCSLCTSRDDQHFSPGDPRASSSSPVELLLHDCRFRPVECRAVTPQRLQLTQCNMSVSVPTLRAWLRVCVPVCVHVCAM